MAAVKLKVDGISKWFSPPHKPNTPPPRPVCAIDRVSFEVQENEFVALIGPSGCGKTTLLKIVHGLIPADSGRIEVGGKVVTRPGFDRGMVFQHSGLLPWRTALKNAEFGLEMKSVPPAERESIARHYLKLVGLEGFEDHYPHQLSGGMQQRVGLARAFAIDPDILLMDEPFGALDAQTRELLQEELLRIFAETRKTILFVTHDLDEAIYLADRVVILSARPGRLQQILPIELPRPRPGKSETRVMPQFIEYAAVVWDALKRGMVDEREVALHG